MKREISVLERSGEAGLSPHDRVADGHAPVGLRSMNQPLAVDSGEWSAGKLAAAKGAATVSVCLPARNEVDTVGAIVETIRRELMDGVALVDELIVVDDHSTDGTAESAVAAGAKVFDAASVLPEFGEGHGKGEALWKSLHVSTGDLVVWCDSDIRHFGAHFVTGLLGPLLSDPQVQFTKGFYERPEHDGLGGGRVTELTARPLLRLLFPDLEAILQPLSGEYAGRRTLLEQMPFTVGYGVDLALLIDVARFAGVKAIAQVDLGIRHHRHQTLTELGPQAEAVMQVALSRAGVAVPQPAERPPLLTFSR